MLWMSVMKKSFFLTFFLLICTSLFFLSCGSGILKSGELTFSLNESAVEKISQKAARLADSNEENLSFRICVTLEVDNETLEKETSFNPNKEKKSDEDNKITFFFFFFGKKVKASVSAYYEEIKLASGESEEITVKEGSNPLPVTLKFDEYTIDLLFKFRFLKDGDYVENADYPDEKLSVSINTFKDFENPDFSSEVQNQLEKLLSAGYLLNEEKTSDPEVKAGVYTYTLFFYRLSQAGGKVLVEDDRIAITAEPDEVLYLNSGKVTVAATNAAGTALTQTDAKLFYGGREVPSDYYTYENGIFSIGGEETKLLTSGTYQLFITADSAENGQLLTGSRTVNLNIQDMLYYECDIDGANSPETAFGALTNELNNAETDVVIKIYGNPQKSDGLDYASGYFKSISRIISSHFNNTAFRADLDLSGAGANLSVMDSSDGFFECKYIRSIKLSSNVKEINDSALCACSSLEKIEIVPIEGVEPQLHTMANGKLLVTAGQNGGKKIIASVKDVGDLDFSDSTYSNVNEIGEKAFYNASISKLRISDNITSIGKQAFSSCSGVKTLILDVIPENIPTVTKFEEGVFNYTNPENLIINFDITAENYDNAVNYISPIVSLNNTVYRFGLSYVKNVTFNGNTYLPDKNGSNDNEKVFLYNSLTTLNSITFNGIAIIGENQFNCRLSLEKLTSLVFNDNTNSSEIKKEAFSISPRGETLNVEVDLTGVRLIEESGIHFSSGSTTVESLVIPESLIALHYAALYGFNESGEFTLEKEDGWYNLTGSDASTTISGWLTNKPESITTSDTIVLLSSEDSKATIRTNVSAYPSNEYWFYRHVSE